MAILVSRRKLSVIKRVFNRFRNARLACRVKERPEGMALLFDPLIALAS